MIILNTTFFAEESLENPLREWLVEKYLPMAQATGLFNHVEASRIMESHQPGVVSYAVRCVADSQDTLTHWHDNDAAACRDALRNRWGERIVWFSTLMETI